MFYFIVFPKTGFDNGDMILIHRITWLISVAYQILVLIFKKSECLHYFDSKVGLSDMHTVLTYFPCKEEN